MKKIFMLCISVMLAAAISGCSLFVPHTQTVNINGQPAGAQIIVNGNVYRAPCTVTVPKNKMLNINVTHDGYYPYSLMTSYSLSTTGMLDLVGTFFFLVPALGFISPGAFTLDTDSFYYVLTPVKK